MLVKNSFGYVQQQRPNQNSTSFFSSTSHETCARRRCSRSDCYCPYRWLCPCSPSICCLVSQQCRRLHRVQSHLSLSLLPTNPNAVPLYSINGKLVPPLTTLLALPLLVCSLPIFRVLHSYQMVRCLIACHTPSSYINSLDATLDPKQWPLPDQIAPIDTPEA